MKIRVDLLCLVAVATMALGGAAYAQAAAPTADARARMLDTLQNDPALPSVAPSGYDVTIVVFSDYQCTYCRKLHPALGSLMRRDPKVRIVYRDWPIFGEPSTAAARAAIASQFQGRHAAFNDALMTSKGKLTADGIRSAAQTAGVDWKRLQRDLVKRKAEIDAVLARSNGLARTIGLSGTPGLVIGPYLLPGALNDEQLQRAVDMARKQAVR